MLFYVGSTKEGRQLDIQIKEYELFQSIIHKQEDFSFSLKGWCIEKGLLSVIWQNVSRVVSLSDI